MATITRQMPKEVRPTATTKEADNAKKDRDAAQWIPWLTSGRGATMGDIREGGIWRSPCYES